MWRWITGSIRAARQNLHVPRASASNAYADEDSETNDRRDEINGEKERHKHFTSRAKLGSNGKEKTKDGTDREKTFKFQQKYDFWSSLNHHNCALEALGWGAAVVLGIQLTKHPIWTKKVENNEQSSKRCLLYRIAHAIPGSKGQITKNVTENEELQDDTEKTKSKIQENDSLTEVMNDFESMCQKYTGMGRNIEGLIDAKRGDFKSAATAWKEASQLGYVKSEYNLGLCYEVGKGVRKDLKEAVKHYELAAEEGHPQALYNMALIYLKGECGIEKNPRLAITLLESAAQLGLTQAQTYMGVHYTESEEQDMDKAVSFFKAAADQNDEEAQYFLGICYEQGWGVDANECKAAELYAQAASGGHDGAMYNLAVFHHHGLGGLPEDHISAKELFEKAAAAGNQNAKLWLHTPDAYLAPSEWPDHGEHIGTIDEDKTKTSNQNGKDFVRMNSSTSTPSLTEYIRKHLDELDVGKFSQHSLISKLNLLGLESLTSSQSVLSSNSLANWQPQYGSPKISAPSSAVPDQRVLFTVGADEDDLDSLNGLNCSLETLAWEIEHTNRSHHFSSMIHRNSTVPDLQRIACT